MEVYVTREDGKPKYKNTHAGGSGRLHGISCSEEPGMPGFIGRAADTAILRSLILRGEKCSCSGQCECINKINGQIGPVVTQNSQLREKNRQFA